LELNDDKFFLDDNYDVWVEGRHDRSDQLERRPQPSSISIHSTREAPQLGRLPSSNGNLTSGDFRGGALFTRSIFHDKKRHRFLAFE